MHFNFVCTMITMNWSCLTGQLVSWCKLNGLIECLALNVRNLEFWKFLIVTCFLEIDWEVLFLIMWLHVLCYSFWIWVCFEVWIVPLLLHETKVFSEARPCLMKVCPCLVKINCFKPVPFSWQRELTCNLKMSKKMIELGFVVFMKVVALDVSSFVPPNSKLYSPYRVKLLSKGRAVRIKQWSNVYLRFRHN